MAEAEQSKLGARFFPRGTKIAALQEQLGAVEPTPPPKTAAELKREKALAKQAAKLAAKQSKGSAKEVRNTQQLRSKVGMNPEFQLDDPDSIDPFKDPYVLMTVDDPHDDNVRGCVYVLSMFEDMNINTSAYMSLCALCVYVRIDGICTFAFRYLDQNIQRRFTS